MIRRLYAKVHCIVLRSTKVLSFLIHLCSLKFVMLTPSATLVTGINIHNRIVQFTTNNSHSLTCRQRPIVKYSTPITLTANFICRILGNDNIQDLFTIDKHTGQLFIKDTMALDVNHLKSENIFFSVEVIFCKRFQALNIA